MDIATINLMDSVDGTATNAEGYYLFCVLKPLIEDNRKITVSFENATPVSSSFLNSSFGELVDLYGYEKVTQLLSFSKVARFNATTLKRYFQALKDYA